VISFVKQLESESASFYVNLSQMYPKDEDVFHSLVQENKKHITQIQRAYYGVISDALEGCFTFNLEMDTYALKTDVAKNGSYFDTLNQAVDLEQRIIKCYSDAAEQSKSLMADIPRTFNLVAKKRNTRILKLKTLLYHQ